MNFDLILIPANVAENTAVLKHLSTDKLRLNPDYSYYTQGYLAESGQSANHLYLVSDEEIKATDWMISTVDVSFKDVGKDREGIWIKKHELSRCGFPDGSDYGKYKKVIASTNPELGVLSLAKHSIISFVELYNLNTKISGYRIDILGDRVYFNAIYPTYSYNDVVAFIYQYNEDTDAASDSWRDEWIAKNVK